MNPVGQFKGYKFIIIDRGAVLKFPTGKKDGNRLGKRKRFQEIMIPTPCYQKNSELMIDKDKMIVFCTFAQYEALQSKIKHIGAEL